MEWLLLGVLALVGLFVIATLGAVFGLVWFVIALPFRLLGFLIKLPLLLFGLAIGALVLTVVVFLPLAVLLAPALVISAVIYGIWRLARRNSHKAMPA